MTDYSWVNKYYTDLEVIGRGGFGEVLSGINKKTKEKMAIKLVEAYNNDDFNAALKELNNLSRLFGTDNILTYEDYHVNTVKLSENRTVYQLIIIMELAERSLDDLIRDPKTKLSEEAINNIILDIAIGLQNAHKLKCVHLDMKPPNVLFVQNNCKISDWGGSFVLKSEKSTSVKSQISFSKGYVAPEILVVYADKEEDIEATEKPKLNYYMCDIYSFGIMILRLYGMKISEIPQASEEFHTQSLQQIIHKYLPVYLRELVKNMTTYKPELRPDINDVVIYLKNLKK